MLCASTQARAPVETTTQALQALWLLFKGLKFCAVSAVCKKSEPLQEKSKPTRCSNP